MVLRACTAGGGGVGGDKGGDCGDCQGSCNCVVSMQKYDRLPSNAPVIPIEQLERFAFCKLAITCKINFVFRETDV